MLIAERNGFVRTALTTTTDAAVTKSAGTTG
jgi:hypothetical protein